jgi:hypothetical protein
MGIGGNLQTETRYAISTGKTMQDFMFEKKFSGRDVRPMFPWRATHGATH